ncbi:hypothetical protein [Streptomyces sp. NPDC058964]|uniref:hypothetical protein n=1 Tax=Streptomyces sp. NPDC058964 TaxID=3346681 RepID=UPI0036C02334
MCPDTGPARLSYGQARALLDEHTAPRGLGTGWDLHEYRHSVLTHLGEQGTSLLMAKSRHKKPENVRRYFRPSPDAIAELTSLLAPRRQPPVNVRCCRGRYVSASMPPAV